MRGKPEHRQAKHAVSGLHMRYATAHGFDDPGHFIAKDARVRRFRRVQGQRLEHIAEVHACRLDFDHHLTAATWWQGKGAQAQGIQQATLAGLQPQRHRGVQQLLTRRQASGDAAHIAALATEGDFTFRVFPQQLAPQFAVIPG